MVIYIGELEAIHQSMSEVEMTYQKKDERDARSQPIALASGSFYSQSTSKEHEDNEEGTMVQDLDLCFSRSLSRNSPSQHRPDLVHRCPIFLTSQALSFFAVFWLGASPAYTVFLLCY